MSVVSISEETIVKQSHSLPKHEESNQSVETQQSANTINNCIPIESKKSEIPHTPPNVKPQPTANGSSRSRERVKNKAEGHIVSEPVQESSDEPEAHSNMADIGAGVTILGGVVTIGGVIAGSNAVTALGVTAVVVGSTCCLLEGKKYGKKKN